MRASTPEMMIAATRIRKPTSRTPAHPARDTRGRNHNDTAAIIPINATLGPNRAVPDAARYSSEGRTALNQIAPANCTRVNRASR